MHSRTLMIALLALTVSVSGWLPVLAAPAPVGPTILPPRPTAKRPSQTGVTPEGMKTAKKKLGGFFSRSGRSKADEEREALQREQLTGARKIKAKDLPANAEPAEKATDEQPASGRMSNSLGLDGNVPSNEPLALPTAPTQPGAANKRPALLSPSTTMNPVVDELQPSPDNPPRMVSKKIDDPANPLGLTSARNRLKQAESHIATKQTSLAVSTLEPLKDWLITATEAHIDLYKTLNRLPSARVQAEFEKQLALEFAKLRDQTLLDLSRIYLQQGKRDQAIKLLVAVVQSQTRSQVGLDAYNLLQEIGFTEALQLTN